MESVNCLLPNEQCWASIPTRPCPSPVKEINSFSVPINLPKVSSELMDLCWTEAKAKSATRTARSTTTATRRMIVGRIDNEKMRLNAPAMAGLNETSCNTIAMKGKGENGPPFSL